MRGLGAWLLTLPLTAGGLFLAHALSYRAVEPHRHDRQALLEHTGHGYFQYAPVAAALAAGLLLAGFAVIASRSFRGAVAGRISLWPFAVVPALAFAVQEHAERLVHAGVISLATSVEPTFVLGVLLQAPLGLAAFLLARALLAVAERVGALLAPAPHALSLAVLVPRPARVDLARRPVLARGYAGRAPPLLLAL
jgi:hypothetical protein